VAGDMLLAALIDAVRRFRNTGMAKE